MWLIDILLTLLFSFSVYALGYLLHFVIKKGKSQDILFAYAWGLGLGAIAVIQHLLSVLQIQLTREIVYLFSISIIFIFIVCRRRLVPKIGLSQIIFFIPLIAIIALTFSHTIWGSDAHNFWLSKARAFWYDGGINPNNIYVYWPYDHPLLWPTIVSWFYHLLGRADEYWAQIINLISWAALMSIFFIQFKKGFRFWYWFIVFTPFVAANVYLKEYAGNADLLVSLFILLAAHSILSSKFYWTGIFYFLASLTKNDAMPSLIGFIILLTIFSIWRKKFKTTIAGAVLAAVAFLGFIIYWRHDFGLGNRYFSTNINEILANRNFWDYTKYSLMAFREEFRQLYRWGFGWWIIGFSFIVEIKRLMKDWKKVLVYLLMTTQFIGYIWVYYVTPENQATHIATSIHRLCLQVYPGILYLAATLWQGDKKA